MTIAWAALLATIVCSGIGNSLAKHASRFQGRERARVMLVAVGLFGTGMSIYPIGMTGVPLGVAYPVLVGGSMAVVTVIAIGWMGERLAAKQWAGLALIFAGLICRTISPIEVVAETAVTAPPAVETAR